MAQLLQAFGANAFTAYPRCWRRSNCARIWARQACSATGKITDPQDLSVAVSGTFWQSQNLAEKSPLREKNISMRCSLSPPWRSSPGPPVCRWAFRRLLHLCKRGTHRRPGFGKVAMEVEHLSRTTSQSNAAHHHPRSLPFLDFRNNDEVKVEALGACRRTFSTVPVACETGNAVFSA